jgi:NADH-quinone oxidoreductase subunit M
MIYRRTHTRDLDALSAMGLGRALPFAAFTFVIASAASMGIPGFSGFAAEITILLGAWKAYPMAVLVTGAGMVLVAAFTLRALKKTFFNEQYRAVRMQQGRAPVDPDSDEQTNLLPPITFPEKLGAGLLMFATLAVGLYPKLLLDRILPAVEAMRFLKP